MSEALDVVCEVMGRRLAARPVADPGDLIPLPSAARAKFVVPAGSRRLAARSVISYNALRAPRTQAQRAVVAAGLWTGGLQRFTSERLVATDGPELLAELARQLDQPRLEAAIGVAGFDVWWKPVLQLFSPAGTAVGYAKVSRNALTNELVRTEVSTLSLLGQRSLKTFRTPRLLTSFPWRDGTVSVTAPLPSRSRRVRSGSGPFPEILREITQLDDVEQASIGASPWWKGLESVAAGCPELARAMAVLEPRLGGDELRFGRWHGDWVRWNLASHAGQIYVWDWEYSAAPVPVGLDLAHHGYQEARLLRRRPPPAALAEGRAAVGAGGAALGLDRRGIEAVGLLHPLELMAREARAVALGAPPSEQLGLLESLVMGIRGQ